VRAARAVVSTTPGLAETLQGDWRKAARFYAAFAMTEAEYRHGVPVASAAADADQRPLDSETVDDRLEATRT
jgi:hypothetical protein